MQHIMLIAQCRNKLWRTEQGKIIKVEIIITKEGGSRDWGRRSRPNAFPGKVRALPRVCWFLLQ